jgi:8-oxo-dGTP diphosphatase
LAEGGGRLRLRVAAGVLVDAAGRVLIARRSADKHAGGAWEFPGGKLQAGESPRQALDRELFEELGVQIMSAAPLIEYTHSYPDRDITLCVYRVLEWQNEPRGLESQPLQWLEPGRLMEHGLLPADRPIVDALLAVSRS